MADGKKKGDAPADLALIGAAQRVEHYEIAAYTPARNLASQLHLPAVVELLTMSLGEELNAGQFPRRATSPMGLARAEDDVEEALLIRRQRRELTYSLSRAHQSCAAFVCQGYFEISLA